MAVERNLPTNLDQAAHKAARRVAEIGTALEFVKKAEAVLHNRANRICAPDPSTVNALRTSARLLQVELFDASRLEESAARIADEAYEAIAT